MLSVYQPVDELRDIFTELVHEFLSGRLAILDGIMEKRGRDDVGLLMPVLNENARDALKMHDVRRAIVLAPLSAVLVDRELSSGFVQVSGRRCVHSARAERRFF